MIETGHLYSRMCGNPTTCLNGVRSFPIAHPWTRPLFCSCWSRMFSSFRGLGMNPMSQPSFTNRPIHQSLLNFYTPDIFLKSVSVLHSSDYLLWNVKHTCLFYVEEVLGVEGDGCSRDGNILIQCATVAHIGPYGKRYRFSLKEKRQLRPICLKLESLNYLLKCLDLWFTLARSSWTTACCSLSCRLCPGPGVWLGLWLWTWAWTSRSSSRETSESEGLLV